MRNSVAEVQAFLIRYCGLPFCADCLAHELSLSRRDTDAAIAGLDAARFPLEQRWCVRCFRPARTVRAVPRAEPPGQTQAS